LSTKVFQQAMAMGQHPNRHHGREVERGDPATPERLAGSIGVQARRDVLRESARSRCGNAAGELDELQARGNFAGRVAWPPCRARRDQPRTDSSVSRLAQQIEEGEQHAGPLESRTRRASRGKRLGRRGDRVVHDRGEAKVHGPGHSRGRGHESPLPLGAAPQGCRDPVSDGLGSVTC